MSGDARILPAGTPGPVCHQGFGKRMLRPPPPALKPLMNSVSFQTASGIYPNADAPLGVFFVDQYCAVVSSNCVPPTDVTSGILAGKPTFRPFDACGIFENRSHSAAP